jgi:hypothetical protein
VGFYPIRFAAASTFFQYLRPWPSSLGTTTGETI